MEHTCNQVERFNTLSKQVAGVKVDLDEHRTVQQEQEKERLAYRVTRQTRDEEITKKLSTIELALFGNKDLKIVGDHDMISEMHTLMVGGSIIKKTLIWVFSTVIALGGAVILYFELIKNIRNK